MYKYIYTVCVAVAWGGFPLPSQQFAGFTGLSLSRV